MAFDGRAGRSTNTPGFTLFQRQCLTEQRISAYDFFLDVAVAACGDHDEPYQASSDGSHFGVGDVTSVTDCWSNEIGILGQWFSAPLRK